MSASITGGFDLCTDFNEALVDRVAAGIGLEALRVDAAWCGAAK